MLAAVLPLRDRDGICAELEALTQSPGYAYSLATIALHDLYFDPAEAADIDWHERLSYQEISFLGGLMVKKPLDLEKPTDAELQRQVTRSYELLRELHDTHGARLVERMADVAKRVHDGQLTRDEGFREVFGDGLTMTEPIFYSGSGAYDFQYWTLAPQRYAKDQPWLAAQTGLDLAKTAAIIRAIKSTSEGERTIPLSNLDEFLDATFAMFCISEADLADHTSEDVQSVFKAFSLTPGAVNETLREPGQYNRLDSHPLIQLDGGTYFVPVHFNLARSFYESPFYWMLADPGYGDTASVHRGDATEAITAEFLVSVFGVGNVHRSVELRRGATVVGEIDVLAALGRKALIVQCKSKRLTELARRGDTDQLARDFSAAVQDAYDQGLSCRELLRDPTVAAYASDTRINAAFDDAYIACVVSDHYPSLSHQVHVYLDRDDDDDPFPIALSTFDLELVCHYLSDPFELMYYVRQRTDLADYFTAHEEMALLAYHLKNKLVRSPAADHITIAQSIAQLIDANYPVVRGEHPESEAATRLFHEWKNKHYELLVNDLKESNEPGFVDAVFLLFDFSSDAIDKLVTEIQNLKERTRRDGQEHSLATITDDGKTGLSFVTRSDSRRELEQKAFAYAELKKYQTKAGEWLGLGCIASSDRLADVAVYSRAPWRHDPVLDEMTRKFLGKGTAVRIGGDRKLGRNDPCFCGTGLKFKRCHGR